MPTEHAAGVILFGDRPRPTTNMGGHPTRGPTCRAGSGGRWRRRQWQRVDMSYLASSPARPESGADVMSNAPRRSYVFGSGGGRRPGAMRRLRQPRPILSLWCLRRARYNCSRRRRRCVRGVGAGVCGRDGNCSTGGVVLTRPRGTMRPCVADLLETSPI